ncbi:MAG TPA: hypothetical protein VGQ93_17645 [Lysobacter sp.]|nr:hypothetical protein [Lysobacter sp.]
MVSLAAGCSSIPRAHVESPPVVSERPSTIFEADAAVDAGSGEFTIAAGMLDTWNAVGQVVVRLDGVTYEGRAQMLGIYAVQFQGERFLILTRALVMRSPDQGMVTKVGALFPDGKPNHSAAAVELLGVLQRRLPVELALIAAGKR